MWPRLFSIAVTAWRSPGLEPASDCGCDFSDPEFLADPIPQDAAWLAPKASGHTTFLKKGQGLIRPQQFNQCARLAVGVLLRSAQLLEPRLSGTGSNVHHSPPVWDATDCVGEQPITHNQGRAIEDLAVHLNLRCQPAETVTI